MWGFHLIMSPLPMIAPKVKLSQWDKKQSKKQFARLTISSLPRGVVEDICALEGARSQPFPNVYCSGARIKGLWCSRSGLWWQLHPKFHGTASQSKQNLGTLKGGSTWRVALQAQFGQLNSLFLPPTFLLPCSDRETWKCFFLVGIPSLYTHFGTTTEGRVEGRVYQTHVHPALSNCLLLRANHGSLSLFVQGLIGKELNH